MLKMDDITETMFVIADVNQVHKLVRVLKKLLNKFEDIKQEAEDHVLKNGPLGVSQLRHGILSQLDGQKISQSDKGELFISDERSPYLGLKTSIYFEEVVRPYLAARNQKIRLQTKQRELKAELEANGNVHLFEKEWEKLEAELMQRFTELKQLQTKGISFRGKKRIPSVPTGKNKFVQLEKAKARV